MRSPDDLTALCRPCHWLATLQRLLDRTGEPPVWLVLVTATFPASSLRGARSRGGRQRVPRRQPRSCAASERPSPSGPGPGEPALALRTLVERCHLALFAGCLRCRRFVRLDSTPHFQERGLSGSVADLRCRLCCCRCRSRTQWVLLGGWPAAGSGATPLHIASAADAAEVVAVLLDGGADGDVRESTSATPLHYAAAFDSGSAAAALAARGADVGAATEKGVTPLHAAARRDALAVARVLLDYGASVRSVDAGGNTLLHRAASGDAAPAAAALIDRGAEVDARAHDGMTPLHVAALKDAARVARVLVDCGAEVGARAHDGVTPLRAAALKDTGEVLTRLLNLRGRPGSGGRRRPSAPCTGPR